MKFPLLFAAFFNLISLPAHAEFLVTSAITEFTDDGPRQHDIELVSRSKDKDYIVTETSEIERPGQATENRRLITDPSQGGLLVTPDKMILPGNGHKVLRFVLLKDPDNEDHIYRVAIKPTVKGIESDNKVGLKILVGYEELIIVRPKVMSPSYTAERHGKKIIVRNTGNTNVLFQIGQQCSGSGNCKSVNGGRVYAGQTATFDLTEDGAVSYSIWNGKEDEDKTFN